jgi:hypothetical protein
MQALCQRYTRIGLAEKGLSPVSRCRVFKRLLGFAAALGNGREKLQMRRKNCTFLVSQRNRPRHPDYANDVAGASRGGMRQEDRPAAP